jgi:hypothetical protein
MVCWVVLLITAGTDAWDLADDTKLLQRLYALNVLRLEGHSPNEGARG